MQLSEIRQSRKKISGIKKTTMGKHKAYLGEGTEVVCHVFLSVYTLRFIQAFFTLFLLASPSSISFVSYFSRKFYMQCDCIYRQRERHKGLSFSREKQCDGVLGKTVATLPFLCYLPRFPFTLTLPLNTLVVV